MCRIYLFLFFLFHVTFSAQAQRVGILRNNPSSLKWYSIETPHFDILFPKSSLRDGYRMANTMELLYGPVSKTMRAKPIHTPLILQDQSTVSNAFVTINPYRMEFFTMPPQNSNFIGTNNWLNLLSVHEFRHAAQQSYSFTGKNKWIKTLFGEQAAGGLAHMVYPDWFWEGDAVATETALTPSGRGRIPNFNIALKANLLEKPMFSYFKQVGRSFNDFVPNHYVMGYNMIAYLRKEKGAYIWSDIQRRALDKFYLPFSWSIATKKYTGSYTVDLYKETMQDLKDKWRKQVENLDLVDGEQLSKKIRKGYTDYMYPQPLEDGQILSLKSGFDDIAKFVLTNSNAKDQVVFTPGDLLKSGMLSVVRNKIVWVEQAYDPRWIMRSYSNIKTYDLSRRKARKLTSKGRYGAASLSPDGNKIVATEVNSSSDSYVVILDANSGAVLRRWKTDYAYLYSTPRWGEDDKILVVRHKQSEKAILELDPETGDEKLILSFGDENIGHPVRYKNYIFYTSPYSGIDNLYAYDVVNDRKFRVTSTKYGAYNPVIDSRKEELIFNRYEVNGMAVSKMKINPSQWIPIEKVENVGINYFKILEKQEGNADILSKVADDTSKYKLKKYQAWKHLIKPYSYGLAFSSTENQLLLGLASTNYLSTMALDVGYVFNYPSTSGKWFLGMSYQGWYPIIDFRYTSEVTGERVSIYDPTSGKYKIFNVYQDELNTGIRLPFVLTNSKFKTGLSLGSEVTYVFNRTYDKGLVGSFQNTKKKFTFYKHTFSLYRLLKRSDRDLNSKWGTRLDLFYRYTFDYEKLASMFASNLQFYTPGFGNHHYTALRGTYSHAPNFRYNYSSAYHYPRGYEAKAFKNLYTGTIAYGAPVCYPDLSIGPLVNFKRLSLEGFMDYAVGEKYGNLGRQVMRSYGITLGVDGNVFRFKENVGITFTTIYVPETGEFHTQFGFNTSALFQN